jgi:hypothetical protein
MTTESLIQNQIRVALSKAGHTVFRINVGKVKMQNGRWFETGAPKGFSDLFGNRNVMEDGTDTKRAYLMTAENLLPH